MTASSARYWRLVGFTTRTGQPITPDTDWKVGGVYQHLGKADGSPPMYGGWDEHTADFFRLVWTEVGDPRCSAPRAHGDSRPAPDVSAPRRQGHGLGRPHPVGGVVTTDDEHRCRTCRTTVEECMRLRGGRPVRFCCDACAVIGSHYDATPGTRRSGVSGSSS